MLVEIGRSVSQGNLQNTGQGTGAQRLAMWQCHEALRPGDWGHSSLITVLIPRKNYLMPDAKVQEDFGIRVRVTNLTRLELSFFDYYLGPDTDLFSPMMGVTWERQVMHCIQLDVGWIFPPLKEAYLAKVRKSEQSKYLQA